MESLFPEELQNVGQLIHFITYSVGNWNKIRAFTDDVVNFHFYLKMINLHVQEIGIQLEEKVCAWQTIHFNATELCVDWSNDNDNKVRKIIIT